MSIVRAIVIVVVSSVGFGGAGALLGFTLGVGAPAYYRGVFRAANDPGFDPVRVGMGLGFSQGLICGVVIGCVVVLAVAVSRPSHQKRQSVESSTPDIASDRPKAICAWRILVLALVLAAMGCGGIIGFVAGAVTGQLQLYQQNTDAKLAKIHPILKEEPFANVKGEYSSAAQVYLVGTVGSEQTYKALEERLRFLFGDEEARFMMNNVEAPKK